MHWQQKQENELQGERRSRRTRVFTGLVLVVLALVVVGCGGGATSHPAKNVVVLCIDTLRADQVGCYGATRETTPVIDKLAERGMVFEHAQAQSDWTVPATASLFTSRLPSEHGAELAGDVKQLDGASPSGIRTSVETLASILKQNEFDTGLFSANPYLYGSFKRGFDEAVVERQPAEALTDKAIAWLQKRAQSRFFMYMQFMDLHEPIDAPGEYFNHFATPGAGERGDRHRHWAFSDGKWLDTEDFKNFRANRLALYDGAVLSIDTQIGRLLDALKSSGAFGDTLIVVTADHGEEFWDHAELEARLGGDPRGYYGIGHGQSMFQELLHIPLVIAGPPVGKSGRSTRWVQQIDVAPTVLAALELPIPEAMRGRNLVPYLKGHQDGTLHDVPILAESPGYGPDSQALIWQGWKLIVRNDGVKLLYDLASDPHETKDLAADQPDRVAKLEELLDTLRASLERAPDSAPTQYDEKTREQLRTLGYLQ